MVKTYPKVPSSSVVSLKNHGRRAQARIGSSRRMMAFAEIVMPGVQRVVIRTGLPRTVAAVVVEADVVAEPMIAIPTGPVEREPLPIPRRRPVLFEAAAYDPG